VHISSTEKHNKKLNFPHEMWYYQYDPIAPQSTSPMICRASGETVERDSVDAQNIQLPRLIQQAVSACVFFL
jgi:hypothetical protein